MLDYDDLLLYWHVDDGAIRRWPPRSARASTTCWSTSTRTPTSLQAEILLRLKPDGARPHRGRRRRAVDLLVPRRDGREHPASSRTRFTPPARVVTLEENYRSTQPVLDVANALMAEGGRQYRKHLRSVRGAGRVAAAT